MTESSAMNDSRNPVAIGSRWLADFAVAVATSDPARLSALLEPGGHWRDVVSLTWANRRRSGDDVPGALLDAARTVGLRDLRLSERFPAPRFAKRSARDVLEVFFDFTVDAGEGTGIARLVPGADGNWVAWIVFTSLQRLRRDAMPPDPGDPEEVYRDPRDTWSRRREEEQRHDGEPEVLIVGAGQAGLTLGAYLRHLGVDALLVEKNPRVGDNWRQRYDSLALHTPKQVVPLPFLTYPETFPMWIPKDQYADWLEHYASAMELNVWTGAEVTGAEYDAAEGRWTVRIARSDGSETVRRPPHLVLATGGGYGSIPYIPDMPGLDEFGGEVLHTKHYVNGRAYAGKRAMVVGVSTSGHDVAYDLCEWGAKTTMLQRGTTVLVSPHMANQAFAPYLTGEQSIEELDLIGASGFIEPVTVAALQALTRQAVEYDRELIESVTRRGLRLDQGPDDTGWMLKSIKLSGGYYINAGASFAIAEGRIAILDAAELERFDERGAVLRDGTHRPLDLIVLATGFLEPKEDVRAILGDEVAEKTGNVFRFDEEGEHTDMWRPTAQRGLWIMGGGIPTARNYGRYLALQLAAALRGLHPLYQSAGDVAEAPAVAQ